MLFYSAAVRHAEYPHRDKTNKDACVPVEYSDQPGHPPGLLSVFPLGSLVHVI